MSVETPVKHTQRYEQKLEIETLTKNLYAEWEVDNDLQQSINLLIRKGYLTKNLNDEGDISDDEIAVLCKLKERAEAQDIELTKKSAVDIEKQLTQDEVLEVRQPFEETIGQAADSIGFSKLQEIFSLVRKELNLTNPEQTPTVSYQDLLDGFKELSSYLQGDSQGFTFSFISELYKNKDILRRLDSEQIVEFFNSFGL
jgi:hypothetical protein